MHFIEQFFGFAPDGGSGLLEVVLLTLTLAVSLLAVRWRGESRKSAVHVCTQSVGTES